MEIIRASVDRFEEGYAVAYSNEDNRRFEIPLELMSGIKPGARILLTLKNDSISSVEEDDKATEDARERIKRKYHRLRKGGHL